MGKKRVSKKHARRATVALAAAATATAMSLGPITPAPDADAAGINLYTSGLVFEVLPPIPFLTNLPADPNAISSRLIADGTLLNTSTIFGFMDGASAAGRAIPAVNAASYPFATITNVNFVLIRNPGRANGGLDARFAPLFNLIGQDPVSGNVVPNSNLTFTYAPSKLDVTWAYDFYSDFPIAPNPFSIANSLAAGIFVTNLLGPTQTPPVPSVNGNTYTTVVPDDLALLEPLRLPGRILGLAGINLPFPDPLDAVADAVQPALVILVNIGYSDVVTPSEGGTYNRTFDQFNGPNKPFLSESPLTLEEALQVPGDVVQALIGGIQGELPTGGLVPATTNQETVNTAAASELAPLSVDADARVNVSAGPVDTDVARPLPGDIAVRQSVQPDADAPDATTRTDLTAPTGVEKKKPDARKQVKAVQDKIDTAVAGARKRLKTSISDVRQRIEGFIGKEPAATADSPEDGGDDNAAGDNSASAGDPAS
jgi:PE-PPE domain